MLRHVISESGVRLGIQTNAAIANFSHAVNKEALGRLISLYAYYRRFIKNFTRIAVPLTGLTKSDLDFNWATPQIKAVRALKQRLQWPVRF